ncbi:MAG: YajQ family cyclic di-GMP-binding protein [Sphingobacteriales bacterium]|jgi:uncharacterized protein YajQ (UPF0234 family)|nr:YajQ family cyclic di-GMP-binding protein [Sphingobacteriales bacterium]
MPTFDIVSKVDLQLLDNAINNAKKEILNRYDFNGSKTEIDLDKKLNIIHILTESEMYIRSIEDAIITRAMKQQIDPKCFDFGKEHQASGNMLRKEVKIKEGIDKELAKQIVKKIKDSKLKVEAQIQNDQLRVTAKKIDDLQSVIQLLRAETFEQALQFINMRA